MKFKLIMGMVLTVTLFTLSVFDESKGKGNETGQIAYLEIDGKEHEILIGEKVRLKIGDKKYFVKIRLDPYCIFNKSGLKFKYSSRMGFNLDDSNPSVKIWSIDGDNSGIMIQKFNVAVDEKLLIEAFKDEYIQMKAKIDVKAIQLKKEKNKILDGKRLDIKMGNVHLRQDVYILKKGKSTLAIILQDTLDNNGKTSSEYVDMIKTFAESFEIQK